MVHDLSTWTEPWEVYSDLGFVVLGVSGAELDLLQVLGFRVEIDEEATLALAEPRPIGPQIGYGGYPTIPGFACYRTVEGTFMTAEDLVAAYPTLSAWVDAGDSWEMETAGGAAGFDMMVLVLTNQAIPGPKPALFVTSSIHAREYAPAELMTRFAESLLTDYGSDPDATWILDHHEIHLMLHANPDGRKWAETGMLWRKNTDNDYCTNSSLRGADLNRNFSFQWGCCGGSSANQCSEVYRGSAAASEPETQAVQEYLRDLFPDQRGPGLNDPAPADATGVYLDIHSYGDLVLWPWGFTFTQAPNGSVPGHQPLHHRRHHGRLRIWRPRRCRIHLRNRHVILSKLHLLQQYPYPRQHARPALRRQNRPHPVPDRRRSGCARPLPIVCDPLCGDPRHAHRHPQ
jgi:hypothetical protein